MIEYKFSLSPEWEVVITRSGLAQAGAYPEGDLVGSAEARIRLLMAAVYSEIDALPEDHDVPQELINKINAKDIRSGEPKSYITWNNVTTVYDYTGKEITRVEGTFPFVR